MALTLAGDDRKPELQLVPAARRPARIDFERLVWRWEDSLSIYRRAVQSYNTVLTIRARLRVSDPVTAEQPPAPTVLEIEEHAAPSAASNGGLAQLTRRELEVANLIAQGLSNRQIADALVITHGTAANHVAHVLEKLNAANRTQVAVIVHRRDNQPAQAPPHLLEMI
jgi:DNA-binding CsgD family transcriptional regulator